MRRVIPMTEQFQHFLLEVKENFWGEVYRRTALAWKGLLEELSWKERDRYLVPIKRESDQIGQNILNQGAAASAS
jgi:hypothetical protein